jgi:RNA polymerase primary sigma factor
MAMKMNVNEWDEKGIYYQYLNDISRYPLLTKAEERFLIERIAGGDRKAEEKLVLSNLRFVINIASMYKGQGLSVNELINEGNIGLIEAARRFDPSQKIKFISYAVWWIRQSVTRAISEKARLVRISAEKELVLRRFSKKTAPFRQAIGGQQVIDSDAISEETDYSPDQVDHILKMGLRHSSLDAPIGEDGENTVMDLTPAEEDSFEDEVEAKSRSEYVAQQLAQLTEQEQLVIRMYFGIGQEYSLNLQEIGKVIGLSKERVRQVKENALAHLRELNLGAELLSAA